MVERKCVLQRKPAVWRSQFNLIAWVFNDHHTLGVPTDSKFRYRAGITHVLNEASENGHCYLPQAELIEKVSQCLKTDDHQPIAFEYNALAPLN
jgi:ATP-dependent exoDNAse (exonuclease V) alpha subunit